MKVIKEAPAGMLNPLEEIDIDNAKKAKTGIPPLPVKKEEDWRD